MTASAVRSKDRTLVVGLGNPILGDDAVGLRVAEAVRDALPPEAGVDVCGVCLGGLRLMEALIGYDRVVLVDAMDAAVVGEAGTVRRMTLADLRAARPTRYSLSPHDVDLPTALDLASEAGWPTPDVVVYAVAVEDVGDFGEALSPPVAAAVPRVVAAVLNEVLPTPAIV